VARLLLGMDERCEPLATQSELAAILGVSAGRTAQQVGALQEAWAGDDECRVFLDELAGVVTAALAGLGGVATVPELSASILAALPSPSRLPAEVPVHRIADGLLRVALDRNQALGRADEDAAVLASRRRGGRLILL